MMAIPAFPTEGPILPWLAKLPPDKRTQVLDAVLIEDLAELEDKEAYNFRLFARAEQLPPAGDWRVWGCQAGRGGGKSYGGGSWVAETVEANPGCRFGIFGPTAGKVRDVMVEEALFATVPPRLRPRDGKFYEPSKRRVNFANGARGITYSADEADQSRGANLHFAWADEVGEWADPEAWSNLDMALRKARSGFRPRAMVTTTPRPTDLIRDIFQGPKDEQGRRAPVTWSVLRPAMGQLPPSFIAWPQPDTVITRWSTYANRANLAADFIRRMEQRYAGSRLGRQELEAEILEDTPGALWKREVFDKYRNRDKTYPRLVRLVVAVDPSHASDGGGDACGIVAAGIDEKGHGHVIADETMHAAPHVWGKAVLDLYDRLRADVIVYEDNEIPGKPSLVRDVIRAVDEKQRARWKALHASRDKRTRADPVAAKYEQGQVHHWADPKDPDHLAILEDEMCTWDPTSRFSPNRLDAAVHALSHLMLGSQGPTAAPKSVGTRVSPWRD